MAMTLNKDANITKSNSDISEEILFGAPSSGSFLMDVSVDGHAELIQELTDASRDKGAYAIREAISNAFDATIKAGDLSLPVTVHLPASVERKPHTDSLAEKLSLLGDSTLYASVEDRGVGMTASELRENFAQYGNSDKRGSGAIGSKGLGSKAPLACADFFEVTSVKGGFETRMLLWREEGGNYAKVISEKRTRKHTGTIVRIPVTDEDTRFQMVRQLVLIAGWNTSFNLVAKVGTTDVRRMMMGDATGLGLEFGRDYIVPVGYSVPRYHYSWERPEAVNGRFIYIGKVCIGQSSIGDDVLVDVWRNYDTFRDNVNSADGFQDNAAIDINLMGVRYPLLRNGSVGSSEATSFSAADYIVGCEPGYLNFTVSRDDIKEDDAWRRFVSSLREGLAAYDQRPAVVRHLCKFVKTLRRRYSFIRQRNIEFRHDGTSYTLAGLPISDSEAAEMFSESDPITGETHNLAPLFAIDGCSDGTIRVLHNNHGDMYGITCKQGYPSYGYGSQTRTGYLHGSSYRLSPAEIRMALAEADARNDCAAVLCAVSDRTYRDESSCGDLDVVILTNVGEGCRRIATADKGIRKYLCEDRRRPQDVSVMYVLSEGPYEPTDAEKHILGWFSSYTISDFGEYLKECKSGILLREKKAEEERREAERKARMNQMFRVPVFYAPSGNFTKKQVLSGLVDNDRSLVTLVSEYVNPYQLTEEDIVAIFSFGSSASERKRTSIAYAWILLEATGIVKAGNGRKHKRLVILAEHIAKEIRLDLIGDDRKFDVLTDSTGTFECLMPYGIRFGDDGTVIGDASDFGISEKSQKSQDITAIMLRCDSMVGQQALGAFYRIAGTTGNRDLDSVLSKDDLAERWSIRREAYRYSSGNDSLPFRILPSQCSKGRYDGIRSTAVRLTSLWNKGISNIAESAILDRGAYSPDTHRSLPGRMPYAALQEAMRSLV